MRDQTQPSTAAAPAPERAAAQKLPLLSLATAGLTALDGLLTAACLGLFLWDARAATPLIQTAAPLLAIFGLAGVVAGGIVLVKNKRTGLAIPGSQWANPAVMAGLMLMTAAVFLPLLSALSMLVDESVGG